MKSFAYKGKKTRNNNSIPRSTVRRAGVFLGRMDFQESRLPFFVRLDIIKARGDNYD